MLFDYLKYLLKAKSLHGTHSPFIYEFYEKVFNHDQKLDIFDSVESQRQDLRSSKENIQFEDFGAGSESSGAVSQKSVASIAKRSLKRAKWGRAFHRIVSQYEISTVLELGTSLGITTSYLASANPNATIFTFEGSKSVLNLAESVFQNLQLSNIETHLGNIDETLPSFLKSCDKINFVYLDANHRLEPTLRYFDLIFPHLSEDSIVVFDDIYWSSEMKQAWKSIKEDTRVRQTIDLFEVGIVFFRKAQEREHFILKY
ncbi:Methyltransferase domain-containing protein [Spirosomataceae bacterium TFI 002]|nr:Methyltransferase domain-containing protein [Spirosomataceae bacterium TFI 002]